MRRVYLRLRDNILKRYLVHVAAFNLSLVMRAILGVGTPRGLRGRLQRALEALVAALECLIDDTDALRAELRRMIASPRQSTPTGWGRVTGCWAACPASEQPTSLVERQSRPARENSPGRHSRGSRGSSSASPSCRFRRRTPRPPSRCRSRTSDRSRDRAKRAATINMRPAACRCGMLSPPPPSASSRTSRGSLGSAGEPKAWSKKRSSCATIAVTGADIVFSTFPP